ncbi:hypothetical protein AB1Y20_022339 [Prymnesium parvum]|uniref:ATP-dependent DNA helicase n=1 Tax=Prymnesium parvum TaxID=97485 RepID=A0AB34JGS8_PRYPA
MESIDDDALASLDIEALVAASKSSTTSAIPGQSEHAFSQSSQGEAQPAPPAPQSIGLTPQGRVRSIPTAPATLQAALFRYFGHDGFREGQEGVISAAMCGKDSAVFWATGRGKSICYQLPALMTGRVVVVVSPLISLMADQVNKINNTVGGGERRVAAFLGSAQSDSSIEAQALDGQFLLVYLSPEKLASSGGMVLDRLAALEARGKLLMFAIDEAHCVSEWGHDFRPEYRRLGVLRERLPSVPIMALTATAVPHVQEDILSSLALRSPHVTRSTSYRSNLTLRCRGKEGAGRDLQEIASMLRGKPRSTIIYAPTKGEVERIHTYLKQQGINVGFYHGGCGTDERERYHLAFLSDSVPVMVATVAFGMGIDKPDIRQIIHYGAPKTVEEYYQQIGRAGRDGASAKCTMFANDADFAKYSSDFYVGNLSVKAKQSVLASTEKLRGYAKDTTGCRWALLLSLLGESDWVRAARSCGLCDNCVAAKTHKGDLQRDFSAEATALLSAVQLQNGKAWSHIEKALDISALRPRRSKAILKDLLPALETAGLVNRTSRSHAYGSYDVYVLTAAGAAMLRAPCTPLWLPVPPSLREEERAATEAAESRRSEVKSFVQKLAARSGVHLAAVPEAEFEPSAEKTPVTNALLHWSRVLSSLRERGNEAKAAALEELQNALFEWRQQEAARLRMAPASVIADHVLLQVAYVRPSSVDALMAAGARLTAAGAAHIIQLLAAWAARHPEFGAAAAAAGGAGGGASVEERLVLPKGEVERPAWKLAVPPKGKKTPAWFVSCERFRQGEAIEKIAMQQESGKPVLTSTIVKHLLTACTHGHAVDLDRLSRTSATPSRAQWELLSNAEVSLGKSVVDENVGPIALLEPFLPEAAVPFAERTEAQTAKLQSWYPRVDWYLTLRRAGITPSFESKRARIA